MGYKEGGSASHCYADGTVTGGGNSVVGVFAGMLDGSATICSSDGSASSEYIAGGLAGIADGSLTGYSSSYADVTAGFKAGGLAGYARSDSGDVIADCNASGVVTATGAGSYAGGLIGHYNGSADITNCNATGDVFNTDSSASTTFVGGFIGRSTGSLSFGINNCYATGDVTGQAGVRVGGFLGSADGEENLYGCYANGDVTSGADSFAGGLIGSCSCDVECCFAYADVVGGASCRAGGFAGYNTGNIQNSYAAGSVAAGAGSVAGGFAGDNNKAIENCYARGTIGAGINAGGFIGHNRAAGIVSGCCFNTKKTGRADAFFTDDNAQTVAALTLDSMTGTGAPANMPGFDFTSVWLTKANESTKWYYPRLSVFGSGSVSLQSVTIDVFKVSFNSNGGSAVADKYGSNTPVDEPANPTLAGNVFDGWYSDPGLTVAYDFSTPVTANITLKAKWAELTLSSTDADGKIFSGEGITLTPSCTGGTWVFNGEYFSRSGNAFTALKAGTSTITYTVKGVSVDYEVTVNPELQLNSSDTDGIIYTGGRITLTPNVTGGTWTFDSAFFTRDGSEFTALKTGTSTITYTVEGVSTSYQVTIESSSLPATGQNMSWVWALFATAAALAAVALVGRRAAQK